MNLKTLALAGTAFLGGVSGTVAAANTVKAHQAQVTNAQTSTQDVPTLDYSNYVKANITRPQILNNDSIHNCYVNAVETFVNKFSAAQKVDVIKSTKERVEFIENSKDDIEASATKLADYLNDSTNANLTDALEQIGQNDYTYEVFVDQLKKASTEYFPGGLLNFESMLQIDDDGNVVDVVLPQINDNEQQKEIDVIIKKACDQTVRRYVDVLSTMHKLPADKNVLDELTQFYSINPEFSNNLLSPELFVGATKIFQNVTKETFNSKVAAKCKEIAADVKSVKADSEGVKTRKVMTPKGLVIEKTDAEGNTTRFDASGKKIND